MLVVWGRRNSVNVQKVLWCCEELGLTYEQLGECLGIPVGTVRSRLSRIRQRLRRQLEPALAEGTM